MIRNQTKKYFIKDTSLHGVDDDMFNYADISKVLSKIIETNSPPYNVAIIGKWGLGKSSLINLVINKYKNREDEYLIQEINAWKYEKESLGKVFLKQLWQGISKKRFKSFEVIKREFSEIVNGDITITPSKAGKKKTKKLLSTAGIIAGATVLAFIVYKLIQAGINGINPASWIFWGNVFLSYCKNIATVLLFPVLIGLCKVLLDEYNAKETNKIELNFPIETVDDYEIFLESKIQEKLENAPNLKIVTIIDDLDRLSINKIVEALDALKAFVGFKHCIFIVPFDDEIIKLALEKRRIQQFDDSDDIIESELILDKLFQYKIYLPPLLKFDINKYAIDLIQREIPDFLADYCSLETMQKLLNRIIIHSGVTTPRQVKKLINSFINNYMAACEREYSGKVQKGLFSSEKGQEQLAKFSVLQADFNDFYDLLFSDFSYLKKILECHVNKVEQSNTPESLVEYFQFNNDGTSDGLKPEYESLVNFLIRTAKYDVENIAPYMYLAQDEISRKTGDEIQRRAINALESGNTETLHTMIKDNPPLADTLTYYLSVTNDYLVDALSTAISLFESVTDEYKGKLAYNIVDRTLEVSEPETKFLYTVPPKAILTIANQVDDNNFGERFFNAYLHSLSNAEWLNTTVIISALDVILPEWDSLEISNKTILRDIATLCLASDNVAAQNLIPIIKPEDTTVFDELWGTSWFDKLCKYINTANDFSDDVKDNLAKTFNQLVIDNDINILIKPMFPLLGYSTLLPIIDSILTLPICEKLTQKNATQIADTIIQLDTDECGKEIYNLLSRLSYTISSSNSEAFNVFTANFKTENAMDDVLIYCGKKGYFRFLEPTIAEFSEAIFQNDENDDLLSKIQEYFTDTQREAIFSSLTSKSPFSSGADYSRLIMLFPILAKSSKNKLGLNTIASTTLMPQLQSRYSYGDYFDFVSQSIGHIKSSLQQDTIDQYVAIITSFFSNYRTQCLNSTDRISGYLSKENFGAIFPQIIENSLDADFELSLDVIINNNSLRPTDSNSLTAYRNFLVQHIATSINPNRILDTLSTSFSRFSGLDELVGGAKKNKLIDQNKLINLIAMCIDNTDSIENVTQSLLSIFVLEDTQDIIYRALQKIEKHTIDDIFVNLCDTVDETISIDVLIALIELSNHYNVSAALSLKLKAISLSFAHDNQPQKITKAIRFINDSNRNFDAANKSEIAKVLYSGFHSTTSEEIKGTIMNVVSATKLKRQFKSLLNVDEENYYKKWVK